MMQQSVRGLRGRVVRHWQLTSPPVGPTRDVINIGRLSPAFPVTPPDMRVRIRRFGGLSCRPPVNLGIPRSTVRLWPGFRSPTLPQAIRSLLEGPFGLHPYPPPRRPTLVPR